VINSIHKAISAATAPPLSSAGTYLCSTANCRSSIFPVCSSRSLRHSPFVISRQRGRQSPERGAERKARDLRRVVLKVRRSIEVSK
jgi:hypothetical protein